MHYLNQMAMLRRPAGAIVFTMIAAVILTVSPSESQSQVKLNGMELVGAEVTPHGAGIRLLIKTKGEATIPDENILVRPRHTFFRLHIMWLQVDKTIPKRTVFDTSAVEKINEGLIFRNGSHTHIRLRLKTPGAVKAAKGYTINRTPEGLELIFPFQGDIVPPSVAENMAPEQPESQVVAVPETTPKPDQDTKDEPPKTDTPSEDKNTIAFEDTEPEDAAPSKEAEIAKAAPVVPVKVEKPPAPPVKVEKSPVAATPTPKTPPDAPKTAALPPAPVVPAAAPQPPAQVSDRTVELVGVLCISMLVALALMLGFRSLRDHQQNQRREAPKNLEPAPMLSTKAQVLASYPIDAHTRILFLDLLGDVMAFSQSQAGTMQLLYRLGPEASAVLYREMGDEPPSNKAKMSQNLPQAFTNLVENEEVSPMTPNPDSLRSSSRRLLFKAPVFETSAQGFDSSFDSSSGDFGHTLESLSQEIHLKALEEGRNKEGLNVAHGMPSPDSTQSNSTAWWLNRVGEQKNGIEDSDLFRALVHNQPTPVDFSEVQDSSMIDISFVVGEDDLEQKLVPPPSAVS